MSAIGTIGHAIRRTNVRFRGQSGHGYEVKQVHTGRPKILHDQSVLLDSSYSRCREVSCESVGIELTKSDSKSVAYEFRTKSAQSGGLETNGPRERISGFGGCLAVRRFDAKPVVIGLLCALASRRECWTRKDWRRERNWDPTVSEVVATILLQGVRLETNRLAEKCATDFRPAASHSLQRS